MQYLHTLHHFGPRVRGSLHPKITKSINTKINYNPKILGGGGKFPHVQYSYILKPYEEKIRPFHHLNNDPLSALNLYFFTPDRYQQVGVGDFFFFFKRKLRRMIQIVSSIVHRRRPHQTFNRPTSSKRCIELVLSLEIVLA